MRVVSNVAYERRKDWTQSTDVAAANPSRGAGDDGPDIRRIRQISGAAARRLSVNAVYHAASQRGGGRNGVQLFFRLGSVTLDEAEHRKIQLEVADAKD